MPWLDPAGRFSALKAATLLGVLLPGTFMSWAYVAGALGARPLNELIHASGSWAIRLLFLALAITPLRQISRVPRLILTRRIIGVAAFGYAALHLTLYAADKMFDLAVVGSEIVRRVYLAIGAVGLVLLLMLAAISSDDMIRRLGGKRWQALQRSTYVVSLLACLHFLMQAKIASGEPMVMAGCLLWLMGYRVISWRAGVAHAAQGVRLALLSLVAGLATALGEAAYFGLFTGVAPLLVLEADVTATGGLRPAWIVCAGGIAAALVAALRAPLPAARAR
jgi:sulfoxide reductase heme-binding subunit YedZ